MGYKSVPISPPEGCKYIIMFVMPTEECTYVQKLFYFEIFANLHCFNYKKIVFKYKTDRNRKVYAKFYEYVR